MKTLGYENVKANPTCPDMIKQQILAKMEEDFKTSAMKEQGVAIKCGMRYQMIFTDRTLYGKANDYFGNDQNIDTNVCDACRNPPSKPANYGVKPASLPLQSAGFTRFWLNAQGVLQSRHHNEEP